MTEQDQEKKIIVKNDGVFGQRFLQNELDVFEFNAWDNVDWTEEKELEIDEKLKTQKASPLDENIKSLILEAPEKQWEEFYRTHKNKFFMDRKWLMNELPELLEKDSNGLDRPFRILDVGCGVGNTTIPLLSANTQLFIYSCDFSKTAIDTLCCDERIDCQRCCPFVWDITQENHTDKKKLLRLCCEVGKNRRWLQKLYAQSIVSQFIRKHWRTMDETQALVLIYELTIGHMRDKELTNQKLRKLQNILSIETTNLNRLGFSQEKLLLKSNAALLPRYVRVNALKKNYNDVLECLKSEGWQIRKLKKTITPLNYRRLVIKLEKPKIYIDPHIPNLLIFPSGTDLHENVLFKQGALILQDKASCFPAFLLQPEPGSSVIDACAAPGMKTTHLADMMKNKGSIWAFDRSKERIELMKKMMRNSNATIIHAECKDFLKIDIANEFNEVKYALVDPPCSGSGMAKRGEFLDEFEQIDEKRLQSLSNLQSMLLKHAFKLPSLQRLVYSTCSVHFQENESVILEILNDKELFKEFELIDPFPMWKHRGFINENISEEVGKEMKKCLSASPSKDLTNGFFIAVFERRK